MYRNLMVVLVVYVIFGCTSQRFYEGAIYIVNSCGKTIHVTANHYTSSISPVEEGDATQFELSRQERKVVAVFTLARSDKNIAYLFSEEGEDFQIKVSDGKREKVFHGQQLYRLSVNVTSGRDRKHDDVNYEIRSKEICP
ncbi:hypothetical protein GJV06_15790 [Enterobacteriaceae bacterium RIT691]|nr:hypothetical protein [Enterobacteriaceae bacterium RIT691]